MDQALKRAANERTERMFEIYKQPPPPPPPSAFAKIGHAVATLLKGGSH
jgi:hypothetical protein